MRNTLWGESSPPAATPSSRRSAEMWRDGTVKFRWQDEDGTFWTKHNKSLTSSQGAAAGQTVRTTFRCVRLLVHALGLPCDRSLHCALPISTNVANQNQLSHRHDTEVNSNFNWVFFNSSCRAFRTFWCSLWHEIPALPCRHHHRWHLYQRRRCRQSWLQHMRRQRRRFWRPGCGFGRFRDESWHLLRRMDLKGKSRFWWLHIIRQLQNLSLHCVLDW